MELGEISFPRSYLTAIKLSPYELIFMVNLEVGLQPHFTLQPYHKHYKSSQRHDRFAR